MQILILMRIIRKLLWVLFLLILLGGGIAFGYYLAVTKNTSLRPEKLLFSEKAITLYDMQNNEIRGIANNDIKQSTSIENIPLYVKQAFIDTEDKRFYQHNGFDYKRIVGASLHNLKAHAFKEGASTISQQLIKNTHLSQEKTLKRKLQESKLTRSLEKKYSKDEILERYLNTIYFGHNCFGITSAANFYFEKTPAELTLSEGAILAGLVKSPNHYSPFRNAEKCKKRKACVLSLMQQNGSIDERQKQQALNEPLPTQNEISRSCDYLHFVFEELGDLAEKEGIKIGGKIEIFTYFDPQIQADVEEIANAHTESDKSIFVLDNDTRGFKACVSTVGNIPRLPGSLIKPLLVYAPALEKNVISPATPILDEKINYGGYSPENYGGGYHGYVSVRECVEKSLNIPAVKILESIGVHKACEFMNELSLGIEKGDESLALALGGMKIGFSLKDITAAYSTFANEGNYQQGCFIKAVKINGVTVYKRGQNSKQIFGKDTAYLMTDMLKGVATRGTAKKLRSFPYEIAAKTGTVGTEKGNTDAYALSYTTKDCISVWLGNADNEKISYTGGGLPCNILLKINEKAALRYQERGEKISAFVKSSGIESVKLDKPSYYDRHTMALADPLSPAEYSFSELFKKEQIPLKQSDIFSNPSILSPALSVKETGVVITFHAPVPTYYTYQILRLEYGAHTPKVLYQGNAVEYFTDDTIVSGKTYQYFVVPIFQDIEGKPIKLPTVSTENTEKAEKDKILDKEWWDY